MTYSGMMTGFYEARTICHKFQLYTGFTAGRPPLLSVLLTVLHLPMVGICRARKALGIPYAQGRWPCVFCGLRPALLSSLLVYDIINVIIELY